MGIAIIIALFSVAAGAALGFIPSARRWTAPVKTFAVSSAVAVVALRILPESLEAVGLGALAVGGIGFALPTLVAKLISRQKHEQVAESVALELGFVGLILHKLGDGLIIGAVDDIGVQLSIGAHGIPVIAVLVWVYLAHSGIRPTLLRCLTLAAAMILGIVAIQLLPAATLARFEPWITAAVGGLLLHVVLAHTSHQESANDEHVGDGHAHAHGHAHSHGHGHAHGHAAAGNSSILDTLALALGVGLVLLSDTHELGHGGVMGAFIALAIESAPALLGGLFIAAVLQVFAAKLPFAWLIKGSTPVQALKGAVVGMPLPICACGVLPLASTLRQQGGRAALVVAFVIATPELGVETLLLTAKFTGWTFAWWRLVAAVAFAIAVALLVGNATQTEPPTARAESSDADADTPIWKRFLRAFDELLRHVGPWTLIGLMVAAYTATALEGGSTASTGHFWLDALLVTAIAIPSYVCAAAATPLAVVLMNNGLSPELALVGLLLGPATNIATFGFFKQTYGKPFAWRMFMVVIAVAWVIGGLTAWANPSVHTSLSIETHTAHVWESWVALALAAIAIISLMRNGSARWFHTLIHR